MLMHQQIFRPPIWVRASLNLSDVLVLLILGVGLYLGIRLSFDTPAVVRGPTITLRPEALPYYSLLSLRRMFVAYSLSLVFSMIYGYTAARRHNAGRWLLPILDILQSVPILSFLPVILLSLTALLPQQIAVELAAVVLIFTSQAWNLTFSFYQSMTTIPTELREAAAIFRLGAWLRFQKLELPFAALGLIWNSVMSWAGGWFFLMAAEIFTLGDKDFRLPGLGAYLQTAAAEGNTQALILGIATLVVLIVALDQLVWRPLLAWGERFKVSQVENDEPGTSWFRDSLSRSWFLRAINSHVIPHISRISEHFNHPPRYVASFEQADAVRPASWIRRGVLASLGVLIGFGVWQAARLLLTLTLNTWAAIFIAAAVTLLRVIVSVMLALLWTIPAGVLIGTNAKAARLLQPLVQILAAIPATALFPVLLLGLLNIPGGGDLAAIVLMLLGTQWYILFNIIAGAAAIPQDLKYTSDLLRLHGWRRWRILILPALFPYIITGLITASGGAWNASIVAEFTHFGGKTSQVIGLGALITSATAQGDYARLFASTLTMIVIVVLFNRCFWRRLYRMAETRYRMDQ